MPDATPCAAVAAVRAEIPWRPARFFRAIPGGAPVEAHGYEWRGLALRHSGWATPRTETRWTLVHIGSGASIVRFTGDVATVFAAPGEIALCGDWTLFDLPEGWRQTDPELPAKVATILAAHPEARPDVAFAGVRITDADARAVIAAREAPPVERDVVAEAKREREAGDARFRAVLADCGSRGGDALRDYDARMRDVESGVAGARGTWQALSPAQRRTLLFLAAGRVLVRSVRIRGGYYDAVGAGGGVSSIAKAARVDTVRNLARRELVAWDGSAFDPEARAVLNERGRFVIQHGQKEASDA